MVHDRGGKSDIRRSPDWSPKGFRRGKSFDRGPKEFRLHHAAPREGNIMLIAEKNVVSTHPLNSIKNVAKLMEGNDFRRIPVTNAGTGRLEGMVAAIDILDFLGGGQKYNIIEKDYGGNFLAAINCPIQKIMKGEYPFLDENGSMDDVVEIMVNKRASAIPIIDREGGGKVIAIATERDVLPIADKFGVLIRDVMQKECITSSLGMMISDVSKIMVRNRLRRLPVIQEDRLIGIVTVFDVLRFLGYGEFHGVDAEEVLSERVEKIMEKSVVTVKPGQDLAAVSRLVRDTNLGGFPVVEDGELLGIVTTTDVIRRIYDKS